MTNVYDISPDASDDEDFQQPHIEEYLPFVDLKTLLERPAHLSTFLNYTIMQNKPNNLLFVLCVHHYQRQEKSKDIRKAASEIFTDFLNPSAVLRVSFPHDVLNEISIGLHQLKDPRQLQNIYNKALIVATKHVNCLIKDFKNKLDMGLGNAYNVQALYGLQSFEDEKRVAKQILIDKFEELMKDTNDLHEEKNKALIAAVQYFLEDIGVLHGSSNIARSFSMNKRDVDKIAKKLHSLRNKDGIKSLPTLHNPLGHKQKDPLSPGLESDGSRDNVSPNSGCSDSTSNSTSHEHMDQLETHHNNNRLLPTDSPVKRWKSLPKDHSVIPKRPEGSLRPKSAAEETDMFITKHLSLDGKPVFALRPMTRDVVLRHDLLKRPSSEDMSSNSSDGSNRSPFQDQTGGLGSGDPRRASTMNLIEFEPDPDLDIDDDMTNWSHTYSQLIKTKAMSKKAVQRQDVIHEFVHTEQHYVRKLKVLLKVYYNPLQEHDIIEKVQVVWLFPNLDELIKIHKEFLNKLLVRQQEQNPVEEVTDIITTHLVRYDLKEACAKFCNHQKSALAMFKNTLQHSQKLKNFCYQAEMHRVSKRLDLDQLIGCVLHRITKYPLLLGELKKCTKEESSEDFKKISDAIKLAKDLACFVNLRIRETENANRLERLQKTIDNQITEEMEKIGHLHNMRINAPHRKLMFDGPLTLMIDKAHSLDLLGLLMTDCIVLLQKQDARYLLKPLTHEMSTSEAKAPVIMLQDLHITAIDKREKRFIIVNRNPKTPDLYELKCSNKDQKETWNTSITVAVEQFNTGKLKHLSDQVFVQQYSKHSAAGSVSKTDSSSDSGESEAPSDGDSETESESDSDNIKTDATLDLDDPELVVVTHTVTTPPLPTQPQSPVTTPPLPTQPQSPVTTPHLPTQPQSPRQMTPQPTPPRRAPAPSSKQTPPPSTRPTPAPLLKQTMPSRSNAPRVATRAEMHEERRDDLSDLTSEELILQAMNETRNIQKLCLPIGIAEEGDDVLKHTVERATGSLNKNLKQLLTTVIADGQNLMNLEANKARTDSRMRRLESLLAKHGIAHE